MNDVISDELLMAYSDGELEHRERLRVAKALEQQPHLQSRLRIFERTGRVLGEAYVNDRRLIPASLRQSADRKSYFGWMGKIADLVSGPMPATAWMVPVFALFAGVFGAVVWQSANDAARSDAALVYTAEGGTQAGGVLRAALETLSSSESANGASLAVMQTFVNTSGQYCREYSIASGRGVACRDKGGNWQVLLHSVSPSQPDNAQFAPAGGSNSAIDGFVHHIMQGDALTAEAEKAALAQGWRGNR